MALNPMDAQADGGAADHGQIQGGGWVSNPTTVFSGCDVESEMESVFDAPVEAVGRHHCGGGHLIGGAGTDQPIGFNFEFLAGFPVDEPHQAACLFHERKAGLF